MKRIYSNRFKRAAALGAFIGFISVIPFVPSYRHRTEDERVKVRKIFPGGECQRSTSNRFPPTDCQGSEDLVQRNKKYVADRAMNFVEDGMIVGLGTGTTCMLAAEEIARRITSGDLVNIKVIPCSVEMKKRCIAMGIPVASLSFSSGNIDVMLDGADEVDPNMNIVKGGSGSFLREKMMENYSSQVVILADETKLVRSIGITHPVPVEVISWDYERTIKLIENLPSLKGARGMLRRGNISNPFPDGEYPAITDNGNLIVDLYFHDPIADVASASAELDGLSGVVEHGIFAGQATTILVATSDDNHPLRILGHDPRHEKEVERPWWVHQSIGRSFPRETVDNREPPRETPRAEFRS
eukprot:GSChrysophyteH1.ASY1.ANO1.2086.1 assembled CDS